MSDTFKNPWQRIGFLIAAVSLGALVACSSQDATQLIASGRSHLDKKDYRAAVIEFKNALQRDPSLNEARFLLGRALFESGDSSGALVEFNKLHAAAFDADRVVPRLAEVMLVHGELDKLIAEFSATKLASPKAQASVSSPDCALILRSPAFSPLAVASTWNVLAGAVVKPVTLMATGASAKLAVGCTS